MAKPYNPTAVMEVLVAITSRLYHARVTPFNDEYFDQWQVSVFKLVERMSVQLTREDDWHNETAPVAVREPDEVPYETLMDEFKTLIAAGIPKWETLYL